MSELGGRLDRALTGPGIVRVEHDGRTAEVDVVEVDRLGVRVRCVRVDAGPGARTVQEAAARLPGALRGLPERLVTVEVAPTLGGAVVRTAPEDVRDREFFEARTDGQVTELERLRATGAGRERVPFTVTREVLGRMVDRVSGEPR